MSFKPSLAAISFDIDHTLIDFSAVLENSLARVSETIASNFLVQVSTEELTTIGEETAASYEGDGTDFLKIRKLSFQNALASKQLDIDFTDTLFDIFIEERFRKTIFMPGAEELLSSIPEGIKVTVLSNGNSDPERLGFAHYFDEILIGKDLLHKKPHIGSFSELSKRLKISDPSLILHIGDALHDDVKGAKEAGYKAVWFNPAKTTFNGSVRPDHEVSSLSDIPKILENEYVVSR